jgi:hypothetical protein
MMSRSSMRGDPKALSCPLATSVTGDSVKTEVNIVIYIRIRLNTSAAACAVLSGGLRLESARQIATPTLSGKQEPP